ncbi:U3 small nucleolar RNA-associated protein 6-like protein [Camponotus floridanus]|uniref:U3 small nucleolar RNA-associated protein 6-like protein n=1 Tax=Camponotus floridanus TaxID=104421 RepID=E2AAN7_CAMFO|nr:U3 small nucleolar RNA-associated protein 6-like protein [Camponotus floridanus]
MAEFVEKRCQDMIPQLEQMKRIKLFDKNEIRNISKKLKEHEYKIQRQTKCKEDYLRYIQYEMDLLKLIKQRRDKYGINQNKSDIEFAITAKMNKLYEDAICNFQDDIRFWIAYVKFCKHIHSYSNISKILNKMLQVNRDKPKCWHIVAHWELEENKNKQSARQYLLRGLEIHPDSQLLLELENRLTVAPNNSENNESKEDNLAMENDEIPFSLRTAYIVYQQAFECIKNVKFIIELLNIAKEYNDTEKLQKKIISDMIREYTLEPLMWDTMARRELQGLNDIPMEIENSEQTSLRDRITSCTKVYQTAVKKIKNEEMWSLYIECLLEINHDLQSLRNFKRKLLKTALMQAHQAKKLNEKYYLHWIDMLNVDKERDENARKKFFEVLCEATDIIPNSVNLWHARISHLLQSGQEKEVDAIFPKMTQILEEQALPLWKMRILHSQIRSSKEAEENFRAALEVHPLIANGIRPIWLEWLVLTKGIRAAREEYKKLVLQPPNSLEFHMKMIALEYLQPEISLKHMRYVYDVMTHQFGAENMSIWIDYCSFEMKHGDPKKPGEIYKRAINVLNRNLIETFMEDYGILLTKFPAK